MKKMSKDSKPRYGDRVKAAIEREFSDLAAGVLRGEKDALYWPAFSLGRLVITQGVITEVPADEALRALGRHGRCDWGELCDEDRRANIEALRYGERVLSKYRTENGTAFYVITERDRSRTTILLPEEY